jgi:ABC-type phosphate transport system substrate-binding protein
MMKHSIAAFLLLLCLTGAQAAEKTIANANVAETAIAAKDLKSIYLGKESKWADGSRVVIVILGESELSDAYLKTAAGMSYGQFDKYWKKQVFTGKGKMPDKFDTEAELIAFMAKTPGAIGYVSEEAAKDAAGIKTLTVE